MRSAILAENVYSHNNFFRIDASFSGFQTQLHKEVTMNQEKEQVRFRGRNNVGISKFRRVDAFLISAALGVTFLSAFGCRSIFFPPEYRMNRSIGDGCYLDGEDATSDWNRAKLSKDSAKSGAFDSVESYSGKIVKTSARGIAPYDSSVTRGSLNADEEDYLGAESKTSWFDKFKAPLHLPKLSFPNFSKSEPNPDEISQRRYDDLAAHDTKTRTVETASSDNFQKERKSSNFFTKLFPTREELNDENVLLGGRNSRSADAANSERNFSPRSIVNFSNPFSRKDMGTSAHKNANWRSLEIQNFDQSRFLPPMRMIERYYSLGSVPPVRTGTDRVESYAYGDSTFRSKTASAQRVEKTAALPVRDSYRSSYYTPVQGEINVEDEQVEIPTSPSQVQGDYHEKRSGVASLSPIPATKTSNSPNVGSVVKTSEARSNNRGITRSIPSVVPNQGGVSAVSFQSQGQENRNDGAILDSDSLYGLQEEEYQIVEAFESPSYVSSQETSSTTPTTPPVHADVDETFRNSLGSQRSFSWFSSDSDESVPTPDSVDDATNMTIPAPSPVDTSCDESFPSGETALEPSSAPVEKLPTPEEAPIDAPEPLVTKALDDIVDSAANQDASLLSSNSQNNDDIVNSPKLSGQTIATDLANAIMESVEPEEAASSLCEEPSVLTNLIEKKATQLSESAPTPESVEARKVEGLSAPITEEEVAWIDQIKNAIQSLLAEREECKKRGDDVRICDARLRLLYLVIGEYERSIQEIEDENDPLRSFWEKECRGLETLLENQLEEIDPAFVADRLRSGLDSLSALCQLQVRKILLVESPACYGLFKAREDAYEPGETVFAYSELEYVTSRETEEGFAIDVECRWRLLNADGTPRTSFESQRCSNLSETKLRDIVLNVSIPLPETLPTGFYQLEIQTSDLNAEKAWTCVKRLDVQVAEEDPWPQESTFLGESF